MIEVSDTFAGRRNTVSTSIDSINPTCLQVYWRRLPGYRLLAGLNLLAYWDAEESRPPPPGYEITGGGWRRGEPLLSGLLTRAHHNPGQREWFVSTTDGGMKVLAASLPELRDLEKW
jgi:hypothetical protein